MGTYFSIYLTGKTATKFKKIKGKSKYVTRLMARDREVRKLRKEGIQCPDCGRFVEPGT